MARGQIITRELAQEICDVFDSNNLSVRQLADKYAKCYLTTWQIITGRRWDDIYAKTYHPHLHTPVERQFTNDEAQSIRNLHQAGWRISKLARQFETTDSIIRQILRGLSYKDAGGIIGIRVIRKLSDDIVLQARQMYSEGQSTFKICQALELSHTDVMRCLKEDSWQSVNVQFPPLDHLPYKRDVYLIRPEEREKIRAYFKSGNTTMTMTEVAKQYGVSLSYISRIVSGER